MDQTISQKMIERGVSVAQANDILVALRRDVSARSGYRETFLSVGDSGFGASDAPSVKDAVYGAVGDGVTDDTAAFNAALLTGQPIRVPYTANGYLISGSLQFRSGSWLIGDFGAKLNWSAASGSILRMVSPYTKCGVTGLTVEVTSGAGNGVFVTTSDTVVSGCRFIGCGSAIYNGATKFTIRDSVFTNSTAAAISMTNASHDGKVLDNEIYNAAAFGIWVTGSSYDIDISGNWTHYNSIELIGITSSAYDIRVTRNHAEGCGDNGISVTGTNCTVTANVCKKNATHGIHVYGSLSTVTGNVCIANGQVHNPSFWEYDATNTEHYSGIGINPDFGGCGQGNIVVGNMCDDDQATITQEYGITVGNGYENWAALTSYSVSNYVYASGKIYLCTVAGTSGSVMPSHTSGTATDGTVTWSYAGASLYAAREAYGNIVGPNLVVRNSLGEVWDRTVNQRNTIYRENGFELSSPTGLRRDSTLYGGFKTRATTWSSGLSVVWGDSYYMSSGDRTYRVTNAGGTSTVAPTHTSGTVTGADGIEWLYVGTGSVRTILGVEAGRFTFRHGFYLEPRDQPGTSGIVFLAGAGSPEGKVTAPVGSMYSRTDGGAGTTHYIKESGTGNTGWVAK